jgi:6-phosphogluconolactonase
LHKVFFLLVAGLFFSCGAAEVKPSKPTPPSVSSEPASKSTIAPASPSTEPYSIPAKPEKYWVYIGTYNNAIYQLSFDTKTGKLEAVGVTKGLKNPSFIAIHPSQKYLYAVNEVDSFRAWKGGAISAFSINQSTGKLTLLNHQPSGGPGPCHLSVDRSGKFVLVANYTSGSTEVIPIKEDGSLDKPSSFIQHTGDSIRAKRQAGPHAHSAQVDIDNKFVFVPDLGADKVFIYQFDASKGIITPNEPAYVSVKAGSGPRHFAVHPNAKLAFLLNEMSSTVVSYLYDSSKGTLTEVQTISTLPTSYLGRNLTAEIVMHPSGKFLYNSNRGHDSISIYSINESTGELTSIDHQSTNGKTPRNFNIDPSGEFLIAANKISNTLTVFTIDQTTGKLTANGESAKIPSPVCVAFVPAP